MDLTRLSGTAPVAVRYSWDTLDCCNCGGALIRRPLFVTVDAAAAAADTAAIGRRPSVARRGHRVAVLNDYAHRLHSLHTVRINTHRGALQHKTKRTLKTHTTFGILGTIGQFGES